MSELATLEVPVAGMDCAECTQHVRHAIADLPGVASVDVFLTSEKAVVRLDPAQVDLPAIRKAVEGAGYSVPEARPAISADASSAALTRQTRFLFAGLFAAVLFIVIGGEWLGLFETLNALIPLPIGAVIVLIAGFPVFRNVVRATLHKQIISHTLMTLGVIAALVVGQWVTALLVVFFMRVGDAVERFTTERARRAVKNLAALAPQTARVEQDGAEIELPVAQVRPGDVVIVRPGEQIPVDGEVVSGQATVDQAAITGEGMPVEAGPGSQVYAATYARLGHLRIRATHVGADTTFGKVIRLVEEAEAHRADVQRIADRFSAWFLPIVAGIAALTLIISRDPLATASVLVVACSCSIALATPIAMLASIGAGAQRGLLIKGGRYLELLAQADVLLIDKTGTVTLGKPQVIDIDRELRKGRLGEGGMGNRTFSHSPLSLLYLAHTPPPRRVRRALLGASAGGGGAGGCARTWACAGRAVRFHGVAGPGRARHRRRGARGGRQSAADRSRETRDRGRRVGSGGMGEHQSADGRRAVEDGEREAQESVLAARASGRHREGQPCLSQWMGCCWVPSPPPTRYGRRCPPRWPRCAHWVCAASSC